MFGLSCMVLLTANHLPSCFSSTSFLYACSVHGTTNHFRDHDLGACGVIAICRCDWCFAVYFHSIQTVAPTESVLVSNR
jgi:hypothetical protein